MTSIRIRLFAVITAVTMLVWAGAAGWTAISTHAELERVLDRRLMEASRMVAALDIPVGETPRSLPPPSYSHQLSCQIWSLAGALVGQSAGAPDSPLASGSPGFSERDIDGSIWRVYTHIDASRGIRVMVGDNLAVRQSLLRDLILALLLPAALGLVALGILLWLGVSRALRPLDEVADAIRTRSPDSLALMTIAPVAREVQPLVAAMNGLLSQLDNARQAERDFVANAAHELQTPLAGLKTQTEIARRAKDPAMRNHALERIATSVDRTSGLVRQLLELARAQGRGGADTCFTPLGVVIDEIVKDYELADSAIKSSCALRDTEIPLDQASLRLAIGNLVENAVHHGGPGQVQIECALGDRLELFVIDRGEGIHPSDLDRVRRRFERGKQASSGGAGLGLSIVEAAIAPAEGILTLQRQANGFAAIISFPRHALRLAPGCAGAEAALSRGYHH